MIRPILFCVLCLPLIAGAQTFTDVTPGNLPGIESGDLAWADYNNDGYLDFAIMGRVSASGYAGAIYTGAGDGTFQLLANNTMPRMRTGDLDWGDFDNDGDLDLAMVGERDASPYEITVIMRNNITSFEQYLVTTGSEGGSVMWMDYDNDGDLDLYEVGSFFDNWYPNTVFINTDGAFSTADVFHVKGYSSELAIDNTSSVAIDFDQDGDQDIFASGKYSYGVWNEASLLVNKGVKNIENTNQYRFSYNDLGIRYGSMNQGDFNKDGLMDYVMTGNSSSISEQNTPFSQLLFGTGDGNFSRRGQLLSVYNSSSDVGDIDNDGDLDIVISGQTSSAAQTRVYRNNGSGVFSDAGIDLAGLSSGAVALGDYDNDGDLDILMTGSKTIRLYRNDLLSKTIAPNKKPTAPSNLRFRMENNSVIMEWDPATDHETPAGSLTYNVYVAIAPKKPFKLYPQADAETGKRRVYEQGNASVNTRWTLRNLKTGTYYFSVQSIDGGNAGSPFATEISFDYLAIDAEGLTCPSSEQIFSVTPAMACNWTVSGGTLLQGQGSDMIHVKWDKQPVNPKVTATTTGGSSNSIIPVVQVLPSAAISGPTTVCDMETRSEYRPAAGYSENLTYQWNIDGMEYNTAVPWFEWTSSGDKTVALTTTDLQTGCQNTETWQVAVSQRISAQVNNADGIYTPADVSPLYTYKWEKYVSGNWSVVATAENFRPTTTGIYRISITNAYACTYSSSFEVREIITGVEEQVHELRLMPNPATTSFRIENLPQAGRPMNIAIVDMTGRNRLAAATTHDAVDIDCGSLSPGVYIVMIQTATEISYARIIIH